MSCCNCKSTSQCCEKTAKKNNQGLLLIISAIAILVSFIIDVSGLKYDWQFILNPSWIAVYICALPLAKGAIKTLVFNKKITSSLLVTVAMLSAGILQVIELLGINLSEQDSQLAGSYDYIFVIAEIAFLMTLGEWLEERTIKKTRKGIEKLSSLIPTKALKKIGSEFVQVDAKDIEVSDILAVTPNTAIPVDCVIISGSTTINESSMTGESIPVDKSVGDKLMGGTFNMSTYIEVEAMSTIEESSISKIVEITKEAEGKRAPIARIADKFASAVVPVTILLSILVFCVNYFICSNCLIESMIRALTILIVFCPCAFVLSTPTAIAAAIGNMSNKGMLVKSGQTIENLAKIDEVFFDKTGTLTTAEIKVEDVFTLGISKDELLYYVGSAEQFSEHPIAKTLVTYCGEITKLSTPKNTVSMIGVGVKAQVDDNTIEVVKYDESKHSKCAEFAAEISADSKGIICITLNGNLVGAISFSDTIREHSSEAISELKNSNYKCSMLTGDSEIVANSIAKKIGIENVYSNLTPQDKQNILSSAKDNNSKTCMIGDGVNDAPALAIADVSMAIADSNNDIASDTSSILLVGSDLRKIPFALNFSKKVIRTIKINIAFSVVWNLITTLLASMGYIDPVDGAILHNCSSLLVVLHSASLLKTNK